LAISHCNIGPNQKNKGMTDELKKIESVFSNKIEKLENAKTTLKDEFLELTKSLTSL